ncbi:MAG: hypothetical protein PHQ22_10870 [Sulfuricurvum sp.]|nr:hypothetical protein [Sulfuricurvum sp.]
MELITAVIVWILIFNIGTVCIIYRQYRHAKKVKEVEPHTVLDDVVSTLVGITVYNTMQGFINELTKDELKEIQEENRKEEELMIRRIQIPWD